MVTTTWWNKCISYYVCYVLYTVHMTHAKQASTLKMDRHLHSLSIKMTAWSYCGCYELEGEKEHQNKRHVSSVIPTWSLSGKRQTRGCSKTVRSCCLTETWWASSVKMIVINLLSKSLKRNTQEALWERKGPSVRARVLFLRKIYYNNKEIAK